MHTSPEEALMREKAGAFDTDISGGAHPLRDQRLPDLLRNSLRTCPMPLLMEACRVAFIVLWFPLWYGMYLCSAMPW